MNNTPNSMSNNTIINENSSGISLKHQTVISKEIPAVPTIKNNFLYLNSLNSNSKPFNDTCEIKNDEKIAINPNTTCNIPNKINLKSPLFRIVVYYSHGSFKKARLLSTPILKVEADWSTNNLYCLGLAILADELND